MAGLDVDSPFASGEHTEAWFVIRPGGRRDLVNLLYLPYMSMHLSYVVMGAALAPHPKIFITSLAFLAYALGLTGAHALDELKGRGLKTQLSDRSLKLLATTLLSAAVVVGLFAASLVGPLFTIFVAVSVFFALAYNLEWFAGKLHNPSVFALSWAALPLLSTYYANTGTVSPIAVSFAVLGALTALAQSALSRWLKEWRRSSGKIIISRFQETNASGLYQVPLEKIIGGPEKAMQILVVLTVFMALNVAILRLLPSAL